MFFHSKRSRPAQTARKAPASRRAKPLIEQLEERVMLAVHPIGFVDTFTSTRISGWAFDSDAGATPISVRVDVNGTVVQTVTANGNRGDLTPVVGSPTHGFSVTGSFVGVVTVYAVDLTTGVQTLLKTNNINPIGSLDTATSATISGWAFDSNTPGTPVQVVIDLDGTRYAPVTANASRSDLGRVLGSAAHAFHTTMPTNLAGTHTVNLYAVDSTRGNQILIGTRVFTNHAPIGSVDRVTATTASGWAFDSDSPATALSIVLRIDGNIIGQFTANLARSDLGRVLGSPNHAFNISLGVLAPGAHTVDILAADAATGVTTLLKSTRLVIA